MEFKLEKELPCIKKAGVLSGTLNSKNGAFELVSGDYKQILKKSEHDKVVAASSGKPVQEEKDNNDDDDNPNQDSRIKLLSGLKKNELRAMIDDKEIEISSKATKEEMIEEIIAFEFPEDE